MRFPPRPLFAAVVLLAANLAWAEQPPPPACPAAEAPALHLPALEAAMLEGRPATIVAFGSSTTEGAGAMAPDRTYPARLEAQLKALLPHARLQVLNRGRSGEEAPQMLERLATEVLAARPVLIIWQAGANAVLKGLPVERFRAAMRAGIERIKATGADLVLMDSQRAPQILTQPDHPAFDAALGELATTEHVPLFSRAVLMRRWAAAGTPFAALLGPDGLHHNDRGYDCLARALARAILAGLHRPALMAGR
ncbi:MAG TPA: SGNH/GDSL hydrolase family protein [Crenalkalicoccus sp.]|nr:SGNH/GDSL hydrolase family protein [Crenalkalicoccus sp.]